MKININIMDKVTSMSKELKKKYSGKEYQRKIQILKRQNEGLKRQVDLLEASNQKNLDRIEKLESEIQNHNHESEISYNTKEVENAVKQYIPLISVVFECDELEGLLKGFGIDRNKSIYDISNLIGFVGLVGNGTTFANLLYAYLESNKVPLQKNIIGVAEKINEFYIDRYGLDYNVVDIPNMDTRTYNKKTMKDYDRRTSIFMYYDEIYTPIIMRNKNDVERLALVHGYN